MFGVTKQSTHQVLVPLIQLKAGQVGQVVAIHAEKNGLIQELTRFGIAPQAFVKMIANHRMCFIFKVGEKTIAADRDAAQGIIVRPV